MTAFVVVNMRSGGGRTKREWKNIHRHLEAAYPHMSLGITQRRGDATALVRTALREGHHEIVAVGGDGTEANNGAVGGDGGSASGTFAVVPGAVYEVVDQKTRRRRALKVMLPRFVADADMRARFRLEATITADIESEHIVETLDADVDAETGSPFVVMELLKGEDLGVALARRGALPPDEVVELLRQAARALDRTHAAGVVHRDLKPANLVLTRGDDGEPKIKVLDFGIAKLVTGSGAPLETTCALGTPFYMPPEQMASAKDASPAPASTTTRRASRRARITPTPRRPGIRRANIRRLGIHRLGIRRSGIRREGIRRAGIRRT